MAHWSVCPTRLHRLRMGGRKRAVAATEQNNRDDKCRARPEKAFMRQRPTSSELNRHRNSRILQPFSLVLRCVSLALHHLAIFVRKLVSSSFSICIRFLIAIASLLAPIAGNSYRIAMAMVQVAPSLSMRTIIPCPSASLRSRTRASISSQPLSLPVLGWALSRPPRVVFAATKEGKEQDTKEEAKAQVESNNNLDVEATTRKFGLEAGLWKIFSGKGDEEGNAGKGKKTSQAKELLKRYGGAYLATSISLSIVSFALCYALVQAGVDVPIVLEKVGIHVNETGEKVGAFALAYAAHKALSPVRFPPTVALTPIVASWFGKKTDDSASK